jgi:hypothetical protein
MDINIEELAKQAALAAIEYAGPCDDPRIGWCANHGGDPSLFKCERCGVEHEDTELLPHKPDCSAKKLIEAIRALSAKGESDGQ